MKIDRRKVLDKYDSRCAYCGYYITLSEMQVDHLLSKRNFEQHIKNEWLIPDYLKHLTLLDLNHIDNLMPSCKSCNNYKSANHIEYFRESIKSQCEKLYKNSPMVRLANRFSILTFEPKEIVFWFEKYNKL